MGHEWLQYMYLDVRMLVLFNWREWKIIVQFYTLPRKMLYYSTRITFWNCVIVNFELSNSIVLCLKSYEMHSMQQKCQFILTCDLSYHIRIWFTQNCGIIINWRHFQRLKINHSCRYIIVFNLYNTELLSIGITIFYNYLCDYQIGINKKTKAAKDIPDSCSHQDKTIL